MFPNLLEATKEYWRKLDELEAAYQQGEIPLEEVDARVTELMAELAQERRAAFTYFLARLAALADDAKRDSHRFGYFGVRHLCLGVDQSKFLIPN